MIYVSPDFVLPFPDIPPRTHPPAGRITSLTGATVCLVDNSRMTYAANAGVADLLHRAVTDRGATVRPVQFPLLTATAEQIRSFAMQMSGDRPSAAVIGIAESGITQPTIGLAIELERLGIPTVTLCADPGVALARVTGGASIPGIRIVDMQTQPHHTAGEVTESVREKIPAILAALTGPDSSNETVPAMFPAGGSLQNAWAQAARNGDVGESALGFLRACEAQQLGDGLPVIPPTRRLVNAMLAHAGRPADEIAVSASPPSGWAVSIELAAVNAVMAGCEPAHFPVVLAALEAMDAPQYRLHQAAITTHAGTNLILVSGPLADQAGISSGAGCLGPAQRANLCIGRAVNLCLVNVLRAVPGMTDLGTFGSVAEIGTCFSDKAFGSWPALHELLAGPRASTVTVLRCEAPHNTMDHLSRSPESLLGGIAAAASSIASNNAYAPAELLVVLSPDHAGIIQKHGWGRADVQRYLFETARNSRRALEGRGIHPLWPAWFYNLDAVPVVEEPEHIIVVVAGGPGTHSQVALPWGLSRASTVVVTPPG